MSRLTIGNGFPSKHAAPAKLARQRGQPSSRQRVSRRGMTGMNGLAAWARLAPVVLQADDVLVENEVEDLTECGDLSRSQLPLQAQGVDAQLPGQDLRALLLEGLDLRDEG